MTTPDLDAIRAELASIADRVDRPEYHGDFEWYTSVWATVGRHVPSLIVEVERLRAELDPDTHRDSEPWAQRLWEQRDAALAEVERLRAHILDIAAHATPYGDIPDESGWVGTYLLTAGALHRALGTIGHTAPSCQAEAERDEARAGRDRLHQLVGRMLAAFVEKGHPGRPCLRSGWVDDTVVADWQHTYRECS